MLEVSIAAFQKMLEQEQIQSANTLKLANETA
jgi:hypothetical protein